jgi:hypothetical protein
MTIATKSSRATGAAGRPTSFSRCWRKGETFAEDAGASELVAADCLRRAGRGTEALPVIDGALGRDGDDKVRKALAFERKLIALGDLARHGIWEAEKAAQRLEGGCVCGAVRYRVNGMPGIALACHCKFCQRRTGTAFASLAYFLEADVEVLQGEMTEYEQRSDESGRWQRMQFCPRCGTTVAQRPRSGQACARSRSARWTLRTRCASRATSGRTRGGGGSSSRRRREIPDGFARRAEEVVEWRRSLLVLLLLRCSR